MSKLKKLANQTLVYGISTILVRSLNWIIAPFHSQVFDSDPAGFGIITEMYSYIAFINVLLMYGMETAFFRFASNNKDEESKIFSTSLISLVFSSLVFGLGFYLSADKIATLLSYPNYGFIVKWISIILFFDTLSNIPFAKLRLDGKPLVYVGIKLMNVIITVVLNVILLLPLLHHAKETNQTLNTDLALNYVFLANAVASIFSFVIFLPGIAKSKIHFEWAIWKRMMNYSLPLLIVGLAGIVNETIDRILLKYLLPGTLEQRNVQVGIYGMAYKLSIFMSLVVQAYRMGAEPFFFKQAKDADALHTLAKAMNVFVIAGAFIFLAVSLNLDWIMLIIGKNFRSGKDIVPILLMAYLFLGIFYNLSVWYKVGDKTPYATIISICGALVTIAINVFLIPKYGYWASAWATFASYFVMTIISWLWGNKYYKVPYEIGKIVSYIALTLGLFYLSKLLRSDNTMLNFIVYNSLVICFGIFAWFKEIKPLLAKT